jgi:serine/threonine-protein kinase
MEWRNRVELPGRYEIQHHVANGGMSSVWRARDRLLGRTVAIKLLAEAYAVDATAVKRFEREARAAARVSAHPNMVTIYDFGVAPPRSPAGAQVDTDATAPHAGGAPFIVMEYLAGGSVADAVRVAGGAGIEPGLAVRWIREAAAALDHAHALGVVHRDVKPANMLLDGAQRLHLGDFGIARLVSEATITTIGEVLGTAAYLSPEQALGAAATPASDRYSLAVAAYELLVGSRPFNGDEVLALHRAERPVAQPVPPSEANPALPARVDAVLSRGISAAPAERWPSATEFAHALELAVQGPAAVQFAEAAPYAPFVSYRARRRRPPVWAGALAAVAAVALGAGLATGAGGGGQVGARARGPLTAQHREGTRPATRAGAPAAKHRQQRTTVASTTPAAPAVSATPAAPAVSTPPASTPLALDTSGHELMVQGDYTGAIAAMQRVLAATPPDSLLHAYALFDLGRSLRLAGNPQAAIPVLEQRLRYPNQTGVVAAELAMAERAAGVAPAGGPPGKVRHGDHGHGHGDGGVGLGGPGGGGGGD